MEQIDVPFTAKNAVWCVSTNRPYLPHRDPKNVLLYAAPPNPVKDPNWLAASLPPVGYQVKAEDAVVTEATVLPSIHSEECKMNEAQCEPVREPVDHHQSSPIITQQQALSNVAVASAYSSPASEHAQDMSIPSPTILSVMAHTKPWQPVTEPHTDTLPLRPATAFENRKLDNVMFDSDGHIGFTTPCSAAQMVCVRREKTTPILAKREEEEDDYEAREEEKVNKATVAALGMSGAPPPPSMDEASSQTCFGPGIRWFSKKCPPCALYGSRAGCELCEHPESQSTITKRDIIEKVGDVYEVWGLNRDDAYVDVITGFHKAGNPGKRLCLGVAPNVGKRVVMDISNWTSSHVKITVVTESYVLATETCRDDQVLKFIKDCLWFLFNNGSPLDVVVVDNTIRNWSTPGKYYTASVDPLEMLSSLVKAWGAKYQHVKVR